MSIDNAMDRLRAANPAPDKRLLRAEVENLNDLLSATWQRSTSVQTQSPQEIPKPDRPFRRGWLAVAAGFTVVAIIGLGFGIVAINNDNAPALPLAGPVIIETEADYSARPVIGTFTVLEGADVLGCSTGTWEDTFDTATEDVTKRMTCSEPNTGTFAILFDPDGYVAGPGDDNGPWRVLNGVAHFADLTGEGDFWSVSTGEGTGAETFSGHIRYTP
jgi:hypothetical protein